MHSFVGTAGALRFLSTQRRVCRRRPTCTAQTNSVPLEDRDVPDAHRGLHESLYGGGDAAAIHGEGSRVSVTLPSAFNSDGTTRFSVAVLLEQLKARTAGVYRIIDIHDNVSYIGLSRDVALSVRAHQMQHGENLVAFVHVRTFAFPSRARLERVRNEWLAVLPAPPPGNVASWDSAAAASATAMTPERRAEFESAKRKLRQAMADPLLYRESEHDELDSEAMRNAVENDDWSAEIDRQTAATAAPVGAVAPDSATTAHTPMVSPFAEAVSDVPDVKRLALTESNVEHVLDDVRPMLQADGGDVKLVGIAHGEIAVRLVGACGTCSAASTTLRMGIERALRAAFGDAMVALREVGGDGGSGRAPLSVESVDAVLDAEVRDAIAMLGGDVVVMAADAADGVVSLRYKGPDQLAYGIELVVREKVAGVRDVAFVK